MIERVWNDGGLRQTYVYKSWWLNIYNYHHYETIGMHYKYIILLKIHHNAALIMCNVTLLLRI
jgi:hypothetical protein